MNDSAPTLKTEQTSLTSCVLYYPVFTIQGSNYSFSRLRLSRYVHLHGFYNGLVVMVLGFYLNSLVGRQ
jgi:hypothetical protein